MHEVKDMVDPIDEYGKKPKSTTKQGLCNDDEDEKKKLEDNEFDDSALDGHGNKQYADSEPGRV